MRHLPRLLPALYALCALLLAYCSVQSWETGHPGWALLFAAASIVDLTAAGHTWHQRDELRSARIRAEHAARPDDVRYDWDRWLCCVPAFTSRGDEHDPDHCTRKGHHA